MNIVDGIFSEQVGVHLNIADIMQLSDDSAINTNNSSGVLNRVSSLVNSGQVTNPGLVHLFTELDIDGGVIGVAFLSVICSGNGQVVGFSQNDNQTSITIGSLTAAHEIGHNFGAPHDNQGGSACSGSAGTFLMNPFINGSDTFSQCSLSQIQPVVDRASCLVAVTPNPGLTPDPTPEPYPDIVADFNKGSDGFTFLRDPENPQYSFGRRLSRSGVNKSGALGVAVGGRDNADITDITGSWNASFTGAGSATLSVKAQLIMNANYESDEFVEARIRVDGQLFPISSLTGDGSGGRTQRTRYLQFDQELNLGP